MDAPTCEECGCTMNPDWDGDPDVINGTRDFWTCPECGQSWEDPKSPVAVTEQLFDFARRNGLME